VFLVVPQLQKWGQPGLLRTEPRHMGQAGIQALPEISWSGQVGDQDRDWCLRVTRPAMYRCPLEVNAKLQP